VLAWTLWGQRNPRFAAPVWAGAVLLAAGLGFAGGRGLQALQGLLENLPAGWVARLTRRSAEARENRTALGEIGRIKLSGRIVLRLLGNPGEVPPPLLRESSYNVFHSPIWLGTPSSFEPTAPETNGTSWLLAPAAVANQAVTIAGYLKGGHGILALPGGTARIDDMPAAELHTNRLGAVLAREGPGLAIYSARYAADRTLDGPPLPEDRTVPGAETTALARVAAELHLPAPTLNETVNRVSSFFQNSFTYRLWLPGLQRGATNETALARFLLRDRAGHCEFFATATTLLLRQLGVPARYSVGYSVQERSGRNRYVIRERHAHSWCVYYDEAARVWKDLDTTPASWSATEGALARFWEPLTDAWSRVWFEFQKLRWGQSGFRRYALGVLVAALVAVAARFLMRKKWRQRTARPARGRGTAAALPGLDSEYYLVERALVARGLERRPGETLSAWLARVEPVDRALIETPRKLLRWHYQFRFDPAGLPAPSREQLRTEVAAWLAAASNERGGGP
jgi:transglutaminase-like putative cysteine protease